MLLVTTSDCIKAARPCLAPPDWATSPIAKMFPLDDGRWLTWRVGLTVISPVEAMLLGEYVAKRSERGRRPVQGIFRSRLV